MRTAQRLTNNCAKTKISTQFVDRFKGVYQPNVFFERQTISKLGSFPAENAYRAKCDNTFHQYFIRVAGMKYATGYKPVMNARKGAHFVHSILRPSSKEQTDPMGLFVKFCCFVFSL